MTSVPPTAEGAAVRLSHVRLRDFRNIARADIDLPPAGAALIGENGHGKTNFLEALYYLHLLRSVRGARDTDLIRFGADAFHISAMGDGVGTHARETSAAFEKRGKRKRVTLDGAIVERMSDGLGAVPCVFFSPTDARLASGPPGERRRYIDIVLALSSPRYLSALQRYRGALARRSAALRAPPRYRTADAVAIWEPALAEHGAVLWIERLQWVEWAGPEFARLAQAIGEHGESRLRYLSARAPVHTIEDARAAIGAALNAGRTSDLRRGITHAGPHRDDLELTVRPPGDDTPRELRHFGSAGQQRTAAVALRLLEARTLRERRGAAPLLLLDDPFAELDARRAERILRLLMDGSDWQTVLAVPRAEDVPRELTTLQRLSVVHGEVHPAT